MRVFILVSGLVILALGVVAMAVLDRPYSLGFLDGALKLGGGIVICALFSFKMKWHGFIGAGVIALLGAARGLANLPGLAEFLGGDRPRGAAPLLELGVTVISVLLCVKIIRVLSQERVRRMLESEQ